MCSDGSYTHKQQTFLYLTACCLLEAATQRVLGGDRKLIAVLAWIDYIVANVLALLAALTVVVAVACG